MGNGQVEGNVCVVSDVRLRLRGFRGLTTRGGVKYRIRTWAGAPLGHEETSRGRTEERKGYQERRCGWAARADQLPVIEARCLRFHSSPVLSEAD